MGDARCNRVAGHWRLLDGLQRLSRCKLPQGRLLALTECAMISPTGAEFKHNGRRPPNGSRITSTSSTITDSQGAANTSSAW
jgi:hypothetical protein